MFLDNMYVYNFLFGRISHDAFYPGVADEQDGSHGSMDRFSTEYIASCRANHGRVSILVPKF